MSREGRKRRCTIHTASFKQGYSDAYYGKDKRESYSGQELVEYLAGVEDFLEDYVDVMKELNG